MTHAAIHIPHIDYKALSPLIAVTGCSMSVLMAGLFRGRVVQRFVVPLLAAAALITAIVLALWVWDPGVKKPIIAGALSVDTLTLGLSVLFFISGLATILLSLRSDVVRQAGGGEYYSLLLGSIAGMTVLAGADNLITLFIGIELLSIPLYVLCGARVKQEKSLEAGLKYLVIGSVGSATLLYGLALVYGATSSTNLTTIVAAIGSKVQPDDPLLLTGIALALAGLAFKASVAPFHTWTPDVYQGAPTPVTSFMAVATKAAAFAIILRFFDSGVIDTHTNWAPAMAALAATTIVVGNVGAIAQRSLKRLLGWSGVAQAGYMLSLGYYLRVIAVMWMTPLDVELPTTPRRWVPSVGGWSPLADARAHPEVVLVALLAAAATIFFGIVPQPLFNVAHDVGTALGSLL